MKVLIAPWGDPYRWEEVEYEAEGEIVKSRNSTKLLLNSTGATRIVVIVLDTLSEVKEYKSYYELSKKVEEKVKEYIKSFLKLELNKIDVVVAPGVGNFENKIFTGNMKDYYSFILHELSNRLIPEQDMISVYLDLTHGINFMPVLTYTAVNKICGILAVKKKVNFTVFNSEPYTSGRHRLYIHKVMEKEKMEFNPPERKMLDKPRLLKPLSGFPEEELKNFDRKYCYSHKDEINAFLGALQDGLPLAMLTFYPELEEIAEILKSSVEGYKNYVEIKFINDNKIQVQRKTCFTSNFDVLTEAYLCTRIIGWKNKTEVSLSELEDMVRSLFKGKDRVRLCIIENEIQSIKKNLDFFTDRWMLYSEAYEKVHQNVKDIESRISSPHKRHFFAHAGFERNLVEMKKENNEIFVRYKETSLDTVKKWAQEGLKEE